MGAEKWEGEEIWRERGKKEEGGKKGRERVAEGGEEGERASKIKEIKDNF